MYDVETEITLHLYDFQAMLDYIRPLEENEHYAMIWRSLQRILKENGMLDDKDPLTEILRGQYAALMRREHTCQLDD